MRNAIYSQDTVPLHFGWPDSVKTDSKTQRNETAPGCTGLSRWDHVLRHCPSIIDQAIALDRWLLPSLSQLPLTR